MRISDWSSDVCSSDLLVLSAGGVLAALIAAFGSREGVWHFSDGFLILRWAFYAAVAGGLLAIVAWAMTRRAPGSLATVSLASLIIAILFGGYVASLVLTARSVPPIHDVTTNRSEVHPSDLQSLMRNSYAVF